MKKTYLFMMLLIIWFFSISLLHASGSVFPVIIKGDRSEGLYNSLTKKGLILDQWKITPLCCCCLFSTLLGFSARNCCIVEKQSSRGVLQKRCS